MNDTLRDRLAVELAARFTTGTYSPDGTPVDGPTDRLEQPMLAASRLADGRWCLGMVTPRMVADAVWGVLVRQRLAETGPPPVETTLTLDRVPPFGTGAEPGVDPTSSVPA